MQSQAATVEEYLASLPDDRREALSTVRKVILDNLAEGFEEGMQYGMIGYYVPHTLYPSGYHCDPKQALPFGGLASQKNHMSLYLMCAYGEGPVKEEFVQGFKDAGKKLDMGKACVRFKRIDDLALDVVAKTVGRLSVQDWIDIYEASVPPSKRKKR